MSRVIKFRAWDTRKNKMYSAEELGQDELTINPDGRGFVNVSSSSQRLSQYMHHIHPLQFTGLLDKNGKEIYEGDILKIEHEERDTIITDVKMMDGAFCVKSSWNEYYPMASLARPGDGLEIIGNIYEHSHLLPGVK